MGWRGKFGRWGRGSEGVLRERETGVGDGGVEVGGKEREEK